MSREELEKLNKEQLIEIVLTLTGRLAELEARLSLNSANSSNPPSSDKYKPQPKSLRKKTGRKPGGQKGHIGNGLKIEREPDNVVECLPVSCECCGNNVDDSENIKAVDSRYKVDVEIRTIITRHDQMEVVCQSCGTPNLGVLPAELKSTVQYGEGVRAISVLFTNYAMVGYDKTQKIMNDVFGVPIAASTIVNHVDEFAKTCGPQLKEIAEHLKSGAILNVDETSTKVNGSKHWVHTASSSTATYNTVHEKRGKEGTDDNGVLAAFGGTAVHDCWSPYFKYDNCVHALCNSHLLRELQYVIDNTDQKWALQMQDLLLEMKSVVERYKESNRTELSSYFKKKFINSYERITLLGIEENPLEEGQKKRGKIRSLLDRFIAYRQEISRFTQNFEVPFDNNQAERDIRNVKVKQKVSGGFRSIKGAKNFGKISSIVGTSIKQGLSAFGVISGILNRSVNSLFRETVTE